MDRADPRPLATRSRFLGRAHVEGTTGIMTVELEDLDDHVPHRVELAPAAA